jgi:deoxyadenosine/deoxycytidine kinase
MDTNNAIMLNGNWGAGKTYYFKNILKDKISKTPVFKEISKNYRPILVSLFGLKSVEETFVVDIDVEICNSSFLQLINPIPTIAINNVL